MRSLSAYFKILVNDFEIVLQQKMGPKIALGLKVAPGLFPDLSHTWWILQRRTGYHLWAHCGSTHQLSIQPENEYYCCLVCFISILRIVNGNKQCRADMCYCYCTHCGNHLYHGWQCNHKSAQITTYRTPHPLIADWIVSLFTIINIDKPLVGHNYTWICTIQCLYCIIP